ncbi:hypothetical protein [Sphingomonas yabuuchiae]|uniref:Uncharacterized protein n=1 Tax=Sphingomonas yabuuchiae TaxID=172044 RepID=A0AA41DC26_9SPHN|nr:hypothetical protein [Sphingomonas yabuuchiae]MBB4610324.1 hypothetical protein [Sphingomonas yabuuchiae]MBN3560383.1 hypothetical protein [Sphingomonas yabuuchiae]
MSEIIEAMPPASRFAITLDRIERFYLLLLRAAILVIATVVLIWAAWLAVSATVRIMRSPASVVEQPVSVVASELPAAIAPEAAKAAAKRTEGASLKAERAFYKRFVEQYHGLYQARFEPFRRAEDKRLNRDEFDDNFVQSGERLAALARGEGNFAKDRTDLEELLQVMTQASTLPETLARLNQYKNAVKKPVRRQVERFRPESRRGWDSLSTSCEGWYESPVGCAVTRQVSVPYTQTVTAMALPEGLLSHTQIFRGMQDRYFALLTERREREAASVSAKRADIAEGQIIGWGSLHLMLYVLAGFLVLMFFFLLIAIERHQRRVNVRG